MLHNWIVDLVRATRELEVVSIGSSVRGSLAVERVARAWALLNGRGYVVPEDVERLFVPVLVHRVVFTPALIARARSAGWAAAIDEFRRSASSSRRGRAPTRTRSSITTARFRRRA